LRRASARAASTCGTCSEPTRLSRLRESWKGRSLPSVVKKRRKKMRKKKHKKLLKKTRWERRQK
jgi:Mitochondrial domain of unknown function (DUF1713)